MKKTFIACTMAIVLSCGVCMAAEKPGADIEKKAGFSVRSDHRSFNPFSASYTLSGNVVAKFPNKEGMITIRADKGVAYFFSQKIVAKGSVALDFNGLYLGCDEATILLKKKTAYLSKHVEFKTPNDRVLAPEGRYDWRNRVATFKDASKNGAPAVPSIVYEV